MFRRYWPYILWFIYFLWPFDLFPDTFFRIGWTDDFLLLGIIYWLRWLAARHGYFASESDPFSSNSGNTEGSHAHNDYRREYEERQGNLHRQHEETGDPYSILGINRSASPSEIRQAYRYQASRYHPDKVAHLGEELQEVARSKFRQIQWAYEQLQK